MKTMKYIAIVAALTLATGMTSCKSDEENNAKPSNETLIIEGGNKQIVMKAGDEMMSLLVNADCAWTVDSIIADEFGDEDFFVQPMRGYGNGTLVIMTEQNKEVFGRKASFILKTDGGLKQKVTITQTSGDPVMSISDRSLEYDPIPTSAQTLTVTSNNAWTASLPTGVSWVHLDKTSGSTTTDINVSVDEIMDDVARTTYITFLYGSSSARVKVTQQPKTNIWLSVDRNELYFSTEEWYDNPDIPDWEREHWEHEQYQMVNVTSNANWRVYIPSSASSWVWAEPSQGTGNGEFRVMCSPWSQSAGNRLTSVIVVAGTQDPKQCDILVQQDTNGSGSDEPQPQPVYTLTVADLTSMYVSNNSADFRFSFVSNQPVGEYGLVYAMGNPQPTVGNAEKVVKGQGATSGTVLVSLNDLHPQHTYYVRAFVTGNNGVQYSPNVVTITTSSSEREPGESDNPDPTLAPRQ